MAQIQAQLKRFVLQSVADSATDGGISLIEGLKAFSRTNWNTIKGGRPIQSTATNGTTVTFYIPVNNSAQLGPEQWPMLAQELRELYTATLTVLGISAPDPLDLTQDATILAAMLADDSMQAVRSYMGDYTALRFPAFSSGVSQ